MSDYDDDSFDDPSTDSSVASSSEDEFDKVARKGVARSRPTSATQRPGSARSRPESATASRSRPTSATRGGMANAPPLSQAAIPPTQQQPDNRRPPQPPESASGIKRPPSSTDKNSTSYADDDFEAEDDDEVVETPEPTRNESPPAPNRSGAAPKAVPSQVFEEPEEPEEEVPAPAPQRTSPRPPLASAAPPPPPQEDDDLGIYEDDGGSAKKKDKKDKKDKKSKKKNATAESTGSEMSGQSPSRSSVPEDAPPDESMETPSASPSRSSRKTKSRATVSSASNGSEDFAVTTTTDGAATPSDFTNTSLNATSTGKATEGGNASPEKPADASTEESGAPPAAEPESPAPVTLSGLEESPPAATNESKHAKEEEEVKDEPTEKAEQPSHPASSSEKPESNTEVPTEPEPEPAPVEPAAEEKPQEQAEDPESAMLAAEVKRLQEEEEENRKWEEQKKQREAADAARKERQEARRNKEKQDMIARARQREQKELQDAEVRKDEDRRRLEQQAKRDAESRRQLEAARQEQQEKEERRKKLQADLLKREQERREASKSPDRRKSVVSPGRGSNKDDGTNSARTTGRSRRGSTSDRSTTGSRTPTSPQARSRRGSAGPQQEPARKSPSRRRSRSPMLQQKRKQSAASKQRKSETPQPEDVGDAETPLEAAGCHRMRIPTKAYAPHPREKSSVIVYSNSAVFFGGLVRRHAENSMVVYNFKESAWRSLPSVGDRPPAMSGHTATLYQGMMVVVGGYQGNEADAGPSPGRYANTEKAPQSLPTAVSLLDLSTLKWSRVPGERTVASDRWTEVRRDPNLTRFHTAVEHDATIWLFGGIKGDGSRSNSLDLLDLPTMSWCSTEEHHEAMSPPCPRAMHTAVVSAGAMTVFGGKDALGNPLGDTHSFDFAAHRWAPVSTSGNAPSPRFGHTSTVIAGGSKMMVFGGSTGPMNFSAELFALELATGVWNAVELQGEVPLGRQFGSLFVAANRVHHFGGSGFGGETSTTAGTTTGSGTAFAPSSALHFMKVGTAGSVAEDVKASKEEEEEVKDEELEALKRHAFRLNMAQRPTTAPTRPKKKPSENSQGDAANESGADGGGVSASEAKLLRRFNRFNDWNLARDFPMPARPPNYDPDKQAKTVDVKKLGDRLSKLPLKQQRIVDLQRAVAAGDEEEIARLSAPPPAKKGPKGGGHAGPKQVPKVDPKKIAEEMHERVVKLRENKRAALLRKYLPKTEAAEDEKLSPEEVADCTDRLYAGSLKRSAGITNGLNKKYGYRPPESRVLSKSEADESALRMSREAAERHERLRNVVARKYLKDPAPTLRLSQEEIDASAELMYRGERRDVDL